MTKRTVNKWLHWVGGLLCVAGIWFVVGRLHAEVQGVGLDRLAPGAWIVLGMLAVAYGLANTLLARAWWYLLRFAGADVEFRWAFCVYGLSQLAKYVPGNIFHLAGRQALGMAHGVPAGQLAKSSVWELGLIAGMGCTYIAWALPMPPVSAPLTLAAQVFFASLVAAYVALSRWVSREVARAMLWQAGFLTASGAVFTVILSSVQAAPLAPDLWPTALGCFIVAWLIGLLTPGAPAGVGVREAVLLLLLGHLFLPADLVLSVILSRCVTILGDLMFFCFAATLRPGRSVDIQATDNLSN